MGWIHGGIGGKGPSVRPCRQCNSLRASNLNPFCSTDCEQEWKDVNERQKQEAIATQRAFESLPLLCEQEELTEVLVMDDGGTEHWMPTVRWRHARTARFTAEREVRIAPAGWPFQVR